MAKEDTQVVEISDPQVWELEIDGRHHRVETSHGGVTNKAVWWVDGERLAQKSSMDDALELSADTDHELADEVGAIKVRFTGMGWPRRATHFDGDRETAATKALMGAGGTDLDPEPGSKAARREDFALRHPVLGGLDNVLGGAGKIAVPLVIAALLPLLRRLLPDWDVDLPLPDLPSIPWPDLDLPSVPWPDWSIPWPDISLPGWVGAVLDALRLVWPLLLGVAIAISEYKRRQRNAAARAERRAAHQERDLAAPQPPARQRPDDAPTAPDRERR